MLSKTIAVGGKNGTCFIKVEPLLPSFGNKLSTHKVWSLGWDHSSYIECLCLLGCDVCDIRPVALLNERSLWRVLDFVWWTILILFCTQDGCFIDICCWWSMSLNVEDWSYPQSKCGPWHQVCDNTLVSFASINLSELLLAINFDSYSILQHILDVLLLTHFLSLLVRKCYDLLKVWWVTPSNLDCCWCLCNMSEDSLVKRILLNLGHVLFDSYLFIVICS